MAVVRKPEGHLTPGDQGRVRAEEKIGLWVGRRPGGESIARPRLEN